MQALENALRGAGSSRHVMSLLTQVEVDPDDPAFGNFTKPIEGFYTEEQARGLERELGWRMREDAGRGWRHVVPSPVPQRIVDVALIRGLAETGTVVIAAGGGGIPVVSGSAGGWSGIEAVIDKDLTSALMANALGIDDLIILTAVPGVFLDYGRPAARMIRRATVSELHAYSDEGHFPPGSMRPKIEAALQFLKRGGRRVVIAQLDEALSALRGEAGTQIVPDGS
jgi:carbamate kinase